MCVRPTAGVVQSSFSTVVRHVQTRFFTPEAYTETMRPNPASNRSPRTLRFLLIAVLLYFNMAAADVYRWTDADGTVHYSDSPTDGAEKVELGETSVVPTLKPTPRSNSSERYRSGASGAGYSKIGIASPAHEQTLRNVEGITVSVILEPSLRADEGHAIQLYYDGNAQGEPQAGTQFVISEAERGAHTLAAAVLDANGKVVLRSADSVFFLHRRSILHPPPPGAPSR